MSLRIWREFSSTCVVSRSYILWKFADRMRLVYNQRLEEHKWFKAGNNHKSTLVPCIYCIFFFQHLTVFIQNIFEKVFAEDRITICKIKKLYKLEYSDVSEFFFSSIKTFQTFQ